MNREQNISTKMVDTDFMLKYPISTWKEHYLYNKDYIKLVNKHWFKFAPPTSTSHNLFALFHIFIMVFGCLGNSLVICMYIKFKCLQTFRNVWTLNLAVSDFVMMLKIPIFVFNSYNQGPALGNFGCQLYGFLGVLTEIVSSMTLVAISFSRYYGILHPLETATRPKNKKTKVWIVFIWIYGFLFSMLPLLNIGFNRYNAEGYLTSCSLDYLTENTQGKIFILVFLMITWLIPLTVMSYCYMHILLIVWLSNRMTTRRFGQERNIRNTEIRLMCIAVGTIALWFMLWSPYAIVLLLGVLKKYEYITPFVSMMSPLFSMTASCTNPWIYAITQSRFKNQLTTMTLVFWYKISKQKQNITV